MRLFRACKRCNLEKPITEFAWVRKRKGEWDRFCRPCRSAYQREHYLKIRRRYIDRSAARTRRILDERWQFLVAYLKEHPCVDCGEDDVVVLEFDHLEDKSFTISHAIRNRRWDDVLAEIDKCEIVCVNCHRRRTAKRLGSLRAAKLGLLSEP